MNKIHFFLNSWREFVFFIMVALGTSCIYLKISSEHFDATVLLSPAKFCGEFVEPLALTVERFRSPGYYTSKEFEQCGVHNDESAYDFSKRVKPIIFRQSNIIELNYRDKSAQSAKYCIDLLGKKFLHDQNLRFGEQNFLIRKNVDRKLFNFERDFNISSCDLSAKARLIFAEAKILTTATLNSNRRKKMSQVILSGIWGGLILCYLYLNFIKPH